jgi:hypothetical protein
MRLNMRNYKYVRTFGVIGEDKELKSVIPC